MALAPQRALPRKKSLTNQNKAQRSLSCSQKHPTGMFLMGSPCVPWHRPAGLFSSKRLSAVCHQKTRRPSSRVPPSVQGERLPSFFFYRKKKEAKKNAPSGKVFRSLRGATKGAAFVPRSPNGPLRVPSGTRASPGL